jgi:hypothetical protein
MIKLLTGNCFQNCKKADCITKPLLFYHGYIDKINYRVYKGEGITFFQIGCIPLFLAAEVGNVAVCKELLSSHAEQQLNMQRKVNATVLMSQKHNK